jgi:hypothetical protein
MTDFLEDPRLERAEAAWLEAEQDERRGELSGARSRYADASQLYAEVVFSMPIKPELAETRGMWAVGAVSMAARAGQIERAAELAERFLADTKAFAARERVALEGLAEARAGARRER